MRISHLLAIALLASTAQADWPTFRHDNSRSGYTEESLNGASVKEAWVYRSPQPPRPAWPGPARWDSYANVRGLGSMRNYDPCFHVVVAGNRLFFGSSTDDSIRAINAATGDTVWTFTTDGPVRIAPTIAGEHVYFGSDDGCVYCVDATDGTLVWKTDRVDESQLILNNGRFVSLSPCRTGVLIDGDRAIFAQGMLPWRDTVLYAVDRLTGKTEGDGCYAASRFGLTLEGALLADGTRIVAPAGRVAPHIFNKSDGQHEGGMEGSGGSSVVLTHQNTVLCGPGNKTGWITETDIESRKQKNVHAGPVVSAVTPDGRVMVSRTRLSAWDSTGRKKRWDIPCAHHNEVIVAIDTIILGGDDKVAAHELKTGKLLWEQPVEGSAFGLAVTNNRLYVSTDTGAIYCFHSSDEQPAPQLAETDQSPKTTGIQPPVADNESQHEREDRKGLVGHWVIHREMSAAARRRGASGGERRVSDLTGNAHALLSGPVHIREVGGAEALELDGETNTLLITDDLTNAPLPRDELTVETWIRVDESDSAGGIIGCSQDTKEEKSGWILGFHHQRFVFGLAAEEGPKGITFLRGETRVRPGHWYHVAARYDGQTMSLSVNGELEGESEQQLGRIVYPKTGFYEIGAKHDSGSFHPMYGMVNEVRVYERTVSNDEIRRRYETKKDRFNTPIELKTGPYAQFVSPDSARIRWQTEVPMPTRLVVLEDNKPRRFDNDQPTTSHEVIVDQLPRDRMLHYLIEKEGDGRNAQSLEFELDTHFNFSTPALATDSDPFPGDGSTVYATAAEHILDSCRFERGICLVMGNGDGRLAWELAKRSDLRIIGVDTNEDSVAVARDSLMKSGLYGSRVSFHHVESLDSLPFVGRFANLIVSQRILEGEALDFDADELYRVLRPQGGLVCLGHSEETDTGPKPDALQKWLASTGLNPHPATGRDKTWITAVRPALDGAGEWSHLYGRADNSAFGGEALGGASTTGDMNVQWIGRPGPRAQPDRNGRKPSPLSTGGRLFVQGLNRIIAVDGFNGTVLWALEIPALERFNMPRDCSNWCADEHNVFIAAKDCCWQIDAATGDVIAIHPVEDAERNDWTWDWGYIAQTADHILGSVEKSDTAFRSFWGDAGAGWYDARTGPATFKVCSDALFALNKSDAATAWKYEDGVIINSTITADDEKLYFVESRHPDVKNAQARRIGSKELWEDQFLVALDLRTGQKIWEQPIDTADGTVAFYLAAGDGTLVIDASTNQQYELSSFSAVDGAPGWTQTFDWFERKGDHGKAIQRPAIVNGRVYVRPKVLELDTGKILPMEMPEGKCGTYAATTESLVFRTTKITMWNTRTGSDSSWDRMRPGCWLSTIPASGMLLSPEGGGGCSCGSWMEMSIGFMPVSNDR